MPDLEFGIKISTVKSFFECATNFLVCGFYYVMTIDYFDFIFLVAEISSSIYWKYPFDSLFDYKDLKEFYILHIESAEPKESRKKFKVKMYFESSE